MSAASTSRTIWSYAPAFCAAVFATSSAAFTAYRWDRNGSTATATGSPVPRAVKRTTPPSLCRRTEPTRVMPTSFISGR